jgi:hypothetical protein
MALHKDFPQSPYAILDPGIRWFPADEALRETSMEIAAMQVRRIPAGACSIGGSKRHTYCQRPTKP